MRACLALILAPLLLAATSLEQQRLELRALARMDLRVASIAHKIAAANTARCPETYANSGLLLHALGQYAPGVRAAAKAEFFVRNRASVLAVVPGGAADKAGMREGDELAWLNGRAVDQPALTAEASFESVGSVEDAIASALQSGPVELMFVRHELQRTAILQPALSCPALTLVVPGKKLNAWADGRRVSVTTALALRTADDAELAFILAHEMSHNILKHDWEHAPKASRNRLARQAEVQADEMGVAMMAAAGYDPMAAPRFVAREGKAFDHPGLKARTHMRQADRVRFLTDVAAPLAMNTPAQ